jgi:hypothetical protein
MLCVLFGLLLAEAAALCLHNPLPNNLPKGIYGGGDIAGYWEVFASSKGWIFRLWRERDIFNVGKSRILHLSVWG